MEENNENKNVENAQSIQQNVETQGTENVQEKKKKSGIGLTIFLIILIIALVGGIGYLTKMFLDGKGNNDANNTVTNESKIEGKKIDESKPWVYDGDVEEKEIDNGNYNSKDFIRYPVININSNDAKKVNDEIEKIYKETLSKFGSKDQNMEIFTGMDYDYFENENILSVVINTGKAVINGGGTGTGIYVYNISLDTLNLVSNDELCKIAGFDSEKQAADKINQWEGRQKARSDGQPTFEGVEKGVYYLDKGNKLNFIYKTEAGGRGYQSAVVDKDNDIKAIFDEKDSENKKITDEKTTSQQDYSIFSEFKSLYYRNVDFDSTTPDNNEYCELKFDDEGIPTIKIGEKNIYTHEYVFCTLEIKDIKSDVAAGTTYVTFNFTAGTPGGDTTGNATIRFSNVAENAILGVKANITFDGKNHEYSNKGDFINVTRENVTGKKFVNDFVAEEPYPTMYIYGRDFITFPGTVDRNKVYYINEDDELCVTKIGDNTIYIIAKNIVRLTREQSSNEIYAYTDEDFVESDILEKDERVVYKKAE